MVTGADLAAYLRWPVVDIPLKAVGSNCGRAVHREDADVRCDEALPKRCADNGLAFIQDERDT